MVSQAENTVYSQAKAMGHARKIWRKSEANSASMAFLPPQPEIIFITPREHDPAAEGYERRYPHGQGIISRCARFEGEIRSVDQHDTRKSAIRE